MKRTVVCLLVLLALILLTPSHAWALDDAHHAKAQQAIQKAIAYLRQTQNANGSWSPQPGPAVTAMTSTSFHSALPSSRTWLRRGKRCWRCSREAISGTTPPKG